MIVISKGTGPKYNDRIDGDLSTNKEYDVLYISYQYPYGVSPVII